MSYEDKAREFLAKHFTDAGPRQDRLTDKLAALLAEVAAAARSEQSEADAARTAVLVEEERDRCRDELEALLQTTRKAYYYGDPRPPREAGYSEFVAWQEAQLRKKRRPQGRKAPEERRCN